MLAIALFSSPLSYLALIVINEKIFLPRVIVKDYKDYREYRECVFDFEGQGSKNSREFKKIKSGKPSVLILYSRENRLVDYVISVRKLVPYALLFYLRRLSERKKQTLKELGFWTDLLSYKSFMFMLCSFLIFALACLGFNYLGLHLELVKKFVPNYLHPLLSKVSNPNFFRALCLFAFVVWAFFIVRFSIFFFPENIYQIMIESLPRKELLYNAFSFRYLLPYEESSREFVPPVTVRFDDERRYLKEIAFALLTVGILQFILTFNFIDKKGEKNVKSSRMAVTVLHSDGGIKRTSEHT